ncbi:MAG: hypothetical protein V1904_14985 [Bacteroidota bacterium]
MPTNESKEYAKTAEGLEALADGVHIHNAEPNFPLTLNEQDIRTQKQNLENIREAYEKAQSKADQLHKDYEAQLKKGEEKIAAAQRTLQGFHGLRSQVLKDYGFQPPKPGGRKGKRPPKL